MSSYLKLLIVVAICITACAAFFSSSNEGTERLVLENTEALATVPIWMCIGGGPVSCPDKSNAEFVSYLR